MRLTRREWLGGMAAGLMRAKALGMPIGCQVYPVRMDLVKDFPGMLAELRAAGFETIEMCSPMGYGEFGPLKKMSGAEMKRTIEAAGLRCESCHYTFPEFQRGVEERIAFAKELGLTQMVLSGFGLRATATMDDWRRAATETNAAAEKIRGAGLAVAYHNHNIEFAELDGVLIYDELMRRFDPKLVAMQFQTAAVSVGYQAADYFAKYPGRFLSIHVSDWSTQEKQQVAVGKGVLDWKKLFAAAKTGGVKNYFVEMDLPQMKASVPYLKLLPD